MDFSCQYLPRIIITILLSSFLTGCMVGPDFHTPAAPQVESYTEKPLPVKTAASPGSPSTLGDAQYFAAGQDIPAEWWTLFHSPTLDSLVRIGLANSPNLAAAQATLREAEDNLNAQVGSLMLPSANLQLNASRQRQSESTLGVSRIISLFNLYDASVNVAYTLDFFGASRRTIESYEAQVDYQRYELEAAYLTLTSNIVTTEITAASLESQIQATEYLIQYQEEQLAIVTKQYQLGGASGANVLTQESQVAQTRALLPPLQQQLTRTRDALAVLVGTFPSNAYIPAFDLNELVLPTDIPVSLPSALAHQRPDIRAQEALLHAASANVGVATANLYPQISISASEGWESNSTGNFFDVSNNIWSIGGQLLQPIFEGGSLRAKRRAAIEAYNQAAAQYKQTVLQAFQSVADTLQALQNDALTLQAQQEAETAAGKSLDITQGQFKLGGVSYLTLLTAQQQYQQTRINLIQAQAARLTDTAALFQALGGGWWNRDNLFKCGE